MNDTQIMHAMTLDDSYHVETVLARGTCGVTELVTLDGTGPFIRKRIPLQLARRDIWARLNDSRCPRLPHVQATYELPDLFVVVTDYVPGRALSQELDARGRLSESEALAVIRQVGEAVRELHRLGIVHRDITPTNIILSDDGAHLIDFGIAGTVKSHPGKNRDTNTLGTAGFASPEQYGFARTDFRSDVYSLGRLLGTMLTGAYPDDTAYDRLLADPSVVPAKLSAAIRRACAFEPSSRQQNVDAFLADLDRDSDERQTSRQGSSRPAVLRRAVRHWRGASRRSVVIVAVAAALVVILTAAGVTAAAVLMRRGEAEGHGAGAAAPGTSIPSPADGTPSSGADADVGGRADGSASDDASTSTLKIVESGWSVDAQGYVHYAVGVNNTGTQRVEMPAVRVTGRAGDGTVLFTTEDVYALADPGTVTYCGGQAGDGRRPATVDITVVPPPSYALIDVARPFHAAATNLAEVPGEYGVTFTGEISVDGDTGNLSGQDLRIFVLLRDANGKLCYAESTYIPRPQNGSTAAFAIPFDNPPDYASYEIHAQPW